MKGRTANLHPILLRHLLAIEEAVGVELEIESGYRDPEHNKDVGGVEHSEHTYDPAEGADVRCLRSATRFTIVKTALERGLTRIGIGQTFVHLGISESLPQAVMWTYYPKANA